MAKKLPKDEAAQTEKKSRKKTDEESGGMGSNLTAIRKAAVPIIERLFELQQTMDSDMGGYKADFATIYEEGANSIGCKKSILKKEFKRLLAAKRQQEAEEELTGPERDQIEAFRAAMDGTPFGAWAEGKLAEPAKAA